MARLFCSVNEAAKITGDTRWAFLRWARELDLATGQPRYPDLLHPRGRVIRVQMAALARATGNPNISIETDLAAVRTRLDSLERRPDRVELADVRERLDVVEHRLGRTEGKVSTLMDRMVVS